MFPQRAISRTSIHCNAFARLVTWCGVLTPVLLTCGSLQWRNVMTGGPRFKICESPLLRNTNNEIPFTGLWWRIFLFPFFRGFPDKLAISWGMGAFWPWGLEAPGSAQSEPIAVTPLAPLLAGLRHTVSISYISSFDCSYK